MVSEFNPKTLRCVVVMDTRAMCISKTGACLKCPVYYNTYNPYHSTLADSLARSFATCTEEEANDDNDQSDYNPFFDEHDDKENP